VQVPQKIANADVVDLAEMEVGVFPSSCQVLIKFEQITSIVSQGVSRVIPLKLEILQKRVDVFLHGSGDYPTGGGRLTA